ncbi:MAG: alpha/beta hydrolase [Ruminococcus sp.]|nr:alpha/beta hydrolase [Ruminococcus sp.]
MMLKMFIGAAALVGGAAAACTAGALKLFNQVIPRQDQLRVNISEMADMEKWEEYKKFITPNREWLTSQKLEHIAIISHDGLELHADYFPAEKQSDKLVICNHGYTGCGLRDCSSIAVYFHKLGFDCLLVDHRAHGKSGGDYIGFGILDRFDCRSWTNYIDSRFDCKKKIVLYGVSMGASTVLMASAISGLSENVKAIIADCAFTSPYDVFSHILKRDYHLPAFPVMNINDALCRQKAGYGFRDYSTLDAVKLTKLPILFIHGKEDNFVPTWMSISNYEQCVSEKKLLLIENAAHGAAYYESPKLYEETVKSFIEKHVG